MTARPAPAERAASAAAGSAQDESRLETFLQGGIFWFFLSVVVLAPLPLASNREWSWSLCCMLIAMAGIAWSLNHGAGVRAASAATPQGHKKNRTSQPHGPILLIQLLGFLGVISWAAFQAWTAAPPELAHPLWRLAAETLGTDTPSAISLAPDDTLVAAMRLLCYGLVFFLAFQWGRDEKTARRILQVLVLAGLAYAAYGLGKHWSGSDTLFWFENSAFHRSVHGTFVNRNHFATYIGLVLLCALALLYHRVALSSSTTTPRPPGGRVPRGARVTTTGDRLEQFALLAWKPLLAVLVLTTALVLTHSRGGFGSALLGAVALLACLHYRRRFRNTRSLAVIAAAAGIAAVAFWMTSETLLERLDTRGLSDNLRFSAYELVHQSSRDNPVLGFGYGTFADSFRLYRSGEITGYLDRAHNTYLENIFELGWPAALLLFALVGSCCAICIRGVRKRGRDWVYPAVGVAATVLAGVHAFFDFSLQMPAVAVTYAAILGVACAQSYSSLQ